MKITNIFRHLKLVCKHRYLVFKLSCKAGIPWRGFVHDLSKFSKTEFFESVKYYNGKRSPLQVAREENGYSLAWLHHKGRNKHHLEYWVDISKYSQIGCLIPYKYLVEAICDKIAAGMAYKKKDWTPKEPITYWLNIERKLPVQKHPVTDEFITTVLTKLSKDGLDKALNKKYLKETYNSLVKKYEKK